MLKRKGVAYGASGVKRRLAVALGTLAVVGLHYGVRGWQARSVAFDRALWSQKPDLEDTGNWRNRMADDVIHRAIRPGMTKAEVLSLLGEPESQDTNDLREQYDQPFPTGAVSAMRYVTYVSTFASELNGDAIYVFFDAQGRVVQAQGGMWT